MTLTRQVAEAFAGHAKWVMPQSRAQWGDGIESEVYYIDHDGSAMRWALGAVFAAYLERATVVCQTGFSRVLLTLPILFQAFTAVFAPCIILAWRMNHLGAATSLGALTPGDDYRRFTPLMEITPAWYLAIGFVAGLLFLASGVQLLRRRRSAFALFASAVAVELAGEGFVRLVPGYLETSRQVFGFSDTNLFRDVFIPAVNILLPIMVAAALWLASRGKSLPNAGDEPHGAPSQ